MPLLETLSSLNPGSYLQWIAVILAGPEVFSTAAGVGMFGATWVAGSTAIDVLERATRSHWQRVKETSGGLSREQKEQLLAAIGGLCFTTLLFHDTSPVFVPTGLTAAVLPRLVRAQAQKRRERELRVDLLRFLGSLRAQLAVGNTLAIAVQRTAETAIAGEFARALQRAIDLHMAEGPGPVLKALAEELKLPELELLLLRLEAVREGAFDLDRVVADMATELEEEVWNSRELELESAPTRMIIPMLLGLFPPLLVMLVWPLASTIMDSLGVVPLR